MAANVGDEPEPVEAERDELEAGAARNQPEEFPAVAGETTPAAAADGNGGGCDGVQANRSRIGSRWHPGGSTMNWSPEPCTEVSETTDLTGIRTRSGSSESYADLSNSSRPISMRRISLVPAPIS